MLKPGSLGNSPRFKSLYLHAGFYLGTITDTVIVFGVPLKAPIT